MTRTNSAMTVAKKTAAPLLTAIVMAACAADGGLIETASIAPKTEPKVEKVASIDPQCATLAQQIDTLRTEGTPERLEKIAAGKTTTAVVKRKALQKQAELNRANADFIAKCGPNLQKTASAPPAAAIAAPPAPTPAAAAGSAKAQTTAKAEVAKSGVTVATQPKQ